MCGVSETAIRKFKGANQMTLKNAKIQTARGLQGANLLNKYLANFCGVTQPTISKFCSHSKMELETSEVYVPSSVASHSNKTVKRKVKLLNEDQILDCLYEYNPKLTRAFGRAFLFYILTYEILLS